jgi:hypothetical protein
MAYGLVKDIKGYHIRFFVYNSSIEKSNDGYTVSPIIVAGGLLVPNLVILSSVYPFLVGLK